MVKRKQKVKSVKVTNKAYFLIAAIDIFIKEKVNSLIQDSCFQTLESNWRALKFLIQSGNIKAPVKVKILDISKPAFKKDLIHANDIEYSQLFEKIYSQNYDMPGGEPFGLLLGNYEFSYTHEDCYCLSQMMQIAALAFSPFVAAASPALFDAKNFEKVNPDEKFHLIFLKSKYKYFNQIRQKSEARFLALVLPDFLIMKKNKTANHFCFGNAGYIVAYICSQCFILTGWFKELGHLNIKQPGYSFYADKHNVCSKQLLEKSFTNFQEKNLIKLGFICLRYFSDIEQIKIYEFPTLYISEKNQAQSQSTLDELLCACRLLHYIKIMMRSNIGKYLSTQDCEQYLQKWLTQYCADRDDISDSAKAKYPLKYGQIKIFEIKNNPSKLHCDILLKQRHNFEQINLQLNFKK